MSSSPQSRLANELYLAASMLDGGERQQYLDEHCPDPALRQLVESLLSAGLPAPLEPGSHLGHYEILAKLGSGGMGSVYEAQDSRLNRTVAIKVLTPGKHEGVPATLTREAQAASALNHPNIVTVYEIGREGATEFIAMERIAGRTLAHAIGRQGMELREALRLAAQIAEALAVAHEAGIVHRDLKPGNVMVTDRGLVKVLDFGLAKRMVPDQGGRENPTATLTRPGRVFGTIAYMSPEQAQGLNVDRGTDIFSFGCLLYEMVTGQRAFHEEGDILTLAAVVGKEPRPAQELKPALPHGLQRIIETCLRKRQADRWQSMADVKLLIEQAIEDLQNPAAAPETAAPAAKPMVRKRLGGSGRRRDCSRRLLDDCAPANRARHRAGSPPRHHGPRTYRVPGSLPYREPAGLRIRSRQCVEPRYLGTAGGRARAPPVDARPG